VEEILERLEMNQQSRLYTCKHCHSKNVEHQRTSQTRNTDEGPKQIMVCKDCHKPN